MNSSAFDQFSGQLVLELRLGFCNVNAMSRTLRYVRLPAIVSLWLTHAIIDANNFRPSVSDQKYASTYVFHASPRDQRTENATLDFTAPSIILSASFQSKGSTNLDGLIFVGCSYKWWLVPAQVDNQLMILAAEVDEVGIYKP